MQNLPIFPGSFIGRELVAVGVSVIINCESCLEGHIGMALETIKSGIEMGGGPVIASSRFARRLLEYYGEKK